MWCFIWYYVSQVSGNYHPEGGLAVIAPTLERALEMIETRDYCDVGGDAPDLSLQLKDVHDEQIVTFPDAGCC